MKQSSGKRKEKKEQWKDDNITSDDDVEDNVG